MLGRERSGGISALSHGNHADQQTGGPGALCPRPQQLMTLWMVVSMGSEDDRKTTASQLGRTQELGLPRARRVTVIWDKLPLFEKWLYGKALLTGHTFRKAGDSLCMPHNPKFTNHPKIAFHICIFKKETLTTATKSCPSLPKVCTQGGTNHTLW